MGPETIVQILYALGSAAIGMALVLLWILYRREGQRNAPGVRNDLANVVMLLQTMRDILEQQKALAREFNQAVDARITAIRQVVRAVANEHGRLTRLHTEIRDALETTREDLARIRAHAEAIRAARMRANAGLPEDKPLPAVLDAPISLAAVIPDIPSPSPANEPIEQDASTPESSEYKPEFESEPEPESGLESEPLQVLAEPQDDEQPVPQSNDLIDRWVGLDFSGDQPDPYAVEAPSEPPETPEDAETARAAFRRLLNLAEDKAAAPATNAEPPAKPDPASAPETRFDAMTRSEAIRARVWEYSDAGMPPLEIARELGLGKGEVRLILSIRAREEARGKTPRGSGA